MSRIPFGRLVMRSAITVTMVVAVTACGHKHAPSATPSVASSPTPTPLPGPVPTIAPVYQQGDQGGVNNNGAPTNVNHVLPVFDGVITLHGAVEGSSPFADDITGSGDASCAATTLLNTSGIWQVPWAHSGSTAVNGHAISYNVALTGADHYNGPAVYVSPVQNTVSVDGTAFTAGPGTAIQVNPDGSGTFTLTGYAATGQPVLNGTITWTCSMRRG